MSTTPAARVARLKVTYQAWSIREVRSGKGWTAQHCETGAVVYAGSPAALETALWEIEHAGERLQP